jgi:hypothetical protein
MGAPRWTQRGAAGAERDGGGLVVAILTSRGRFAAVDVTDETASVNELHRRSPLRNLRVAPRAVSVIVRPPSTVAVHAPSATTSKCDTGQSRVDVDRRPIGYPRQQPVAITMSPEEPAASTPAAWSGLGWTRAELSQRGWRMHRPERPRHSRHSGPRCRSSMQAAQPPSR